MASKKSSGVFDTLTGAGIRKKVARKVSKLDLTPSGSNKSRKRARGVVAELRTAADHIEDRITGRGASRKRREAAQKAAKSRKRNAKRRSASAKRGASTRAKRAGGSKGKRGRARA